MKTVTKVGFRPSRWFTRYIPTFITSWLYNVWPFADVFYKPRTEIIAEMEVIGDTLYIKRLPDDTPIPEIEPGVEE